jgi:hypothetical protein
VEIKRANMQGEGGGINPKKVSKKMITCTIGALLEGKKYNSWKGVRSVRENMMFGPK